MKNNTLVLIVTLLLLSTFSLAFAGMPAEEPAKVEPEALFKKVCAQCHSYQRPLAKTKTKEHWETTVKRMQKKDPAKVSDEDAKVIIEFLSTKDEKK